MAGGHLPQYHSTPGITSGKRGGGFLLEVDESKHVSELVHMHTMVQWSEDVIKADPFFGRSWARFRVPPWASSTIARDHLA